MSNAESNKTDGDSTRERILEAAEEVFAEKGFNQATVREILKRAEVGNIAAINYHFGDKERLYVETVKNAHACCNAAPPRLSLRELSIGVRLKLWLLPLFWPMEHLSA